MREAEVVAAFCAWLEQDGWSVQREVEHIDVVAEVEARSAVIANQSERAPMVGSPDRRAKRVQYPRMVDYQLS